MRRKGLTVLFAHFVVLQFAALSTSQEPGRQPMDNANGKFHGDLSLHGENETLSVLVYLKDRIPIRSLTNALDADQVRLQERHEIVVLSLQERAATTQTEILKYLSEKEQSGTVAYFEPFWITNAIRVDAIRNEVRIIASRADVDRVYYNYEIEGIQPVEAQADGPRSRTSGVIEPGIIAVRAPEVWAMGITGAGVLVANIDTGVDGSHPALASRWAGVADPRYAKNPEWAWLDPYLEMNDFPYDTSGHGTHTMGSVCGGLPGDQIGVAPGSYWIAAAPIDRESISQGVADAIESFQWMIDPDGDPSTNFDVPAVCSNSWGLLTAHGFPPCDETFWSFLDANEAAGTVMLFSAGNEGASGLRRPADRATDDYRTLAVGSVNANEEGWPISVFSSRGPTNCTPGGGPAIKPDISAPGDGVRSSLPGGNYGFLSGTSMASPHVNGVIALMREANPDLSVNQIKQILYDTAVDLGSSGEDNDYGWGMIDAFEAVTAALETVALTFHFPNGRPDRFVPTGGTIIRVEVSGNSYQPDPGTGMLHYDTGTGTYEAIAMEGVQPNVYNAVFPAFDCGAQFTYYFSAQTLEGVQVTSPFLAPHIVYSGFTHTGFNNSFEDDFSTHNGWIVEDDAELTAGTWERGTPIGGGDQGDPASDFDGSGPCFLTGNMDGDSDVDNGTTWLISPLLDFTSEVDPFVEYAAWYSNDTGENPNADTFVTSVSNDGGTTWTTVQTIGPQGPGGWELHSFRVADWVTPTVKGRVRFEASDLGVDSTVEAGVDAFRVFGWDCSPSVPDFAVSLSTSQTEVTRGSTLLLDLVISNLDPLQPYTFELWATRELPGGSVQDPWKAPRTKTLAPGETRIWPNLRINIGHAAPLGTYRLHVRIGHEFPGPIWAEDFIEYTVIDA